MGLIVYLGVFMSVLCIPCEAVVTQALRTPVAINSTDSQVYEPDPLSEPSKEKRKGMFGRTVRTVRDSYKDTIQHLQNSGGKIGDAINDAANITKNSAKKMGRGFKRRYKKAETGVSNRIAAAQGNVKKYIKSKAQKASDGIKQKIDEV
ncbi:hypothetical protein CWI39_2315p0010 [Hamiltosporidium magnivora]|uniref:Uncharacterized protein n=1 Tax=Hamiltosporidium magnivora TaxID=148818 RepID=A0A4Q9KUZ5_9MICR|nr:hypothetical protein LUQ84_002800 [Hamiltosporidium tvaerminnensis]TBT98702.1 hypothetical protein CWI39_2315p0010 [Hamiltosporidium magnivora]TBT98937.1 hypothetical protein CWI36_2165p0010 [Hamiltosporidium magnivora]